MKCLKGTLLIYSMIIPVLIIGLTFAQGSNKKAFKYVSPLPGSKLNLPETNIIIKVNEGFDITSINNVSAFNVTGSKRGKYSGKVILTQNMKTVLFYPDRKFENGEKVTVQLSDINKKTVLLQYSFEISKEDLNSAIKSDTPKLLKSLEDEISGKNLPPKKGTYKTNLAGYEYLPNDFPVYEVDTVNDPSPGFISFTPFNFGVFRPSPVPIPYYLIITDNVGIPVFYRKIPSGAFDFKKQRTGLLSYYEAAAAKFYLLDSTYSITDSIATVGYSPDLHELEILENGHALMMSYDYQPYPMDTVVFGGKPNAVLIGLIIQELDKDKNVVFQWRSWDHYKVTDATYNINVNDTLIDYVHGNAIEVDYDGNILISSRHMDEVTKINRETGEIIWRLGGRFCRNNQFTFLNDPIGFSHQHDIRRLPNGNIILFDNGNLHNPQFSRVVEYKLDENNRTAELVWEYRNDPETYNGFMGSARRMDNGNTFIGWGGNTAPPSISEVKEDGTVTFSLTLPDTLINYRAFKFPWKTSIFSADVDTLSFDMVSAGDSLELDLTVSNNSDSEVEINGIYISDSTFTVDDSLPLILSQGGSKNISVKFKPSSEGNYSSVLYLRWDREEEGIAVPVVLTGRTDSIIAAVNNDFKDLDYSLSQNYPNPFNPTTKIQFSIPENILVKLTVYDILGSEVKTLLNNEMERGTHEIEFNAADLPSGVYFYKITAGNFTNTRKFILMK